MKNYSTLANFSVYLGALVAGFVVMALEMIGSRYLSPYFGGSIFTWAALISTVLSGLAFGYFAGGRLSDQFPSPVLLWVILMTTSAWIAIIPFVADPLLSFVFELTEDIRRGSLIAALGLLFVPFVLLGIYTPFALRLVLSDTKSSGTISGRIYGVSTVGSIMGTLLTTFFLIPSFGTRAITFFLAWLTLLFAVCLAIAFRTKPTIRHCAASVWLLANLVLLLQLSPPVSASERFSKASLLSLPDGLIEEIDSAYHRIFILKHGDNVVLTFRRHAQSYDESVLSLVNENVLPELYTRALTAGLLYSDEPRNLLMLGLGGGTTTRYFQQFMPRLQIDVVELDAGVIFAAKRYFGVRETERYQIFESDGRTFLQRGEERYDIIIVDAFRGGYIPFHLLTREFYELAQSRLTEGGCLVIHLHYGTKLFQSSLATINSVYGSVDMYQAGGSSVVIAHDRTALSDDELQNKAIELQSRYGFYHSLEDIITWKFETMSSVEAQLLTDDFAPVNIYHNIKE